MVTLLCFCGKGLNTLFSALEKFFLEKGGVFFQGITYTEPLNSSSKRKTRPSQPGTARYPVLGPGAVKKVLFFSLFFPKVKSRSVGINVIRCWGVANAVKHVN